MPMSKNELVIAAAGSGKTTSLVRRAVKEVGSVLITTYTEANKNEIRNKFVEELGRIPSNVTVQTWFSFLLQHGVRPYQSVMDLGLNIRKIGFKLSEKRSGQKYDAKGAPVLTRTSQPIFWAEKYLYKFYFTKDIRIYSDKISKFVYECNVKTKGEVIDRISRVYKHIYIDEVQDLAGWELEILKKLFNTDSDIVLVGDPRQVVYLTHHSGKNPKYKNGNIEGFIKEKCTKDICSIDPTSLNISHRNNKEICEFSSALFPEFPPCEPCECESCRGQSESHIGIFLVRPCDVEEYCEKYSPTILRYKEAVRPEWNYGKSKGLGFDRVLIYPTNKIKDYLKGGDLRRIETVRARFYVAATRARHSVAIVYSGECSLEGVKIYEKS